MLLRFNLEILNVWAFSTLSNNTICKRFFSLTVFYYIIPFSFFQQLSLTFFIFLFFPVLPCCYLYIIITFSYCQICPFFLYNLTASTLTRFLHIFPYFFKPYSHKAFMFFILFFYFFLVFYFIPLNPLISTLVAISSSFSFYIITKKYFFYFFFTSSFQNQLLWFLSLALLVCYFLLLVLWILE